MSTQDTPLTDAAEVKLTQWEVRSLKAGMRGSHLDSDDPCPPDGWTVARDLERVANRLADGLADAHKYIGWANNALVSCGLHMDWEKLDPPLERIAAALRDFEELKK